MSLRIRELYGYASLQGLPKNGLRAFGVPPGGAFDQESHLLANALVSNKKGAFAIELAMASCKIEVLHLSLISLVGAECEISIDGRSVHAQSAYQLLPGQIIDVGAPTQGCRIYLALHGISSGKKFEQQLVKGNVVEAKPHSAKPGKVGSLSQPPSSLGTEPMRVISRERVPHTPLTASIKSNRVGVRLEGAKQMPGEEQLSEPSCVGAIQVTNDGALVIHGPDGPTVGGYKKIGVVCSADLDTVAQLRPGQKIEFQAITREEAADAWKEKNQLLGARLESLRPNSLLTLDQRG